MLIQRREKRDNNLALIRPVLINSVTLRFYTETKLAVGLEGSSPPTVADLVKLLVFLLLILDTNL